MLRHDNEPPKKAAMTSENEKGLAIVTSESIWDLLPEDFPYEDQGCELFPSCLNCPFPHCIKEEPWGKEKFLKTKRARRMMTLKKEGKDNEEIARIFRVSVRTVQRWLKAVKK
jgi:hypothetical protein